MSKAKRLAEIRNTPCKACGSVPSDACHVRTKKASGANEPFNIIPMCREHHILQHALGWGRFFEKYPQVRTYLEKCGWQFQELKGRFLMFYEGET